MNTTTISESKYVVCLGCNRLIHEGEPVVHAAGCPVFDVQDRRALGIFIPMTVQWSGFTLSKDAGRKYHYEPTIHRIAIKMFERDKQNGHCEIENFYDMPTVEIHRYLSYARAAYHELIAIDAERLNQHQGENHE